MPWHTTKQGEHVTSIAKQYGFYDYKKIWDDPANADLKAKRANPNVLLPGDLLFIPTIQTAEYDRSTERRHPFKLNGTPLQLRIQLQRGFSTPIASNACPTWIDADFYDLTTDEQGLTGHAIKKTSAQGRMLIKNFVPGIRNEKPSDRTIKLNIGFLDPIDSTSGQQARLINLGYYRGALNSYDPDEMRSAVEEFQCDHSEQVDGICGPNTPGKTAESIWLLGIMAGNETDRPPAVLPGGIAGTNGDEGAGEFAVAPSTSNQLNTLRFSPAPVACWSLFDNRFEFDSSFVKPEAKSEFAHLVKLRAKHVGAPLSVFAHSDTTGPDEYNKHLSGRRAKAIYGVLIRDVEGWEQLHNFDFGGDQWGVKADQYMLSALGFYSGEPTGTLDQPTKQAIQSFRGDRSSSLDSDSRKKLTRAYMEYLCGPDLSLSPDDFLARGLDAKFKHDPKGDVQGCADFNPILMFSKEDADRFKLKENKIERDARNAPNRRVLVFLFPPGSFVDFKLWPCPHSTVGAEECKKRFWSDYLVRRKNQDNERTQQKDGDTFACRFYDRISNQSICERIVKLTTLSLRLIDDRDKPFASFSYSLEVMGHAYEGVTDDDGLLEEDIPEDATSGTLTLFAPPPDTPDASSVPAGAAPPAPNVLWTLPLVIADLTPASDVTGAQNRLNNLGFFAGTTATGTLDEQTRRALLRFQMFYQINPVNPSGDLDDETIRTLRDFYGS